MSSRSTASDWLRRARGIVLDAYSPPFFPEIEYDAVQTIRMMKRIGADTVCLGAIGKWAYFPNEFIAPHPGLGQRDLIQETLDAARAEKMCVVVSFPIGGAFPIEFVEKQHPDWQWIGLSGKPRYVNLFGGAPVTPVCLNTEYRKALLQALRDLTSRYNLHAIVLESVAVAEEIMDDLCYCAACNHAMEERFGRKLPSAVSAKKEDVEILTHFRSSYRRLRIETLNAGCKLVKSVKDIPVLYGQAEAGRRIPPAAVREFDAMVRPAEAGFMDHITQAALRTGGKEILLQRIGTHDSWPRVLLNPNQLTREIISTSAFGLSPLIAHSNKLFYDEVQAAPIARTFGFLIRNEADLADLQTVKFAAILTPDADPDAMNDETRGLAVALTNARVQAEPIGPSILDDRDALSSYKVLCLGNIGYLASERVETIRKFIAAGGGLVATFQTSFRDESDKEAGEFALGDVLGIAPMKPSLEQLARINEHQSQGEPMDVYLCVAQQPPGALEIPAVPQRLPQAHFMPITARDDAFAAAHTVLGGDSEPLCPAITLREVGEGRAVYIAGALASLYLRHRLPGMRDLLAACVNWAGGGEMLSIFGPASLFAVTKEKPGTRVLFLINCTGERHDPSAASAAHFAPLHDVQLRLRTSEPVGLVRDLVSGNDLDFDRKGKLVRVTVPKIEEFAVLAFSAEGPKADAELKL
ncbi:MAG: hypothetical protein AB1696_22775 [Planctomycetota bacterium]